FNLLLPVGACAQRVHVEGIACRWTDVEAEGNEVAISQQDFAIAIVAGELLPGAVESVGHIDSGAIEDSQARTGSVAGETENLLRLSNFGGSYIHRVPIAAIKRGIIRHRSETADAEQEDRGERQSADGKNANRDHQFDQGPGGSFGFCGKLNKHSSGSH